METVDFSFIYEILADCYSPDRARPAEDPVFNLSFGVFV